MPFSSQHHDYGSSHATKDDTIKSKHQSAQDDTFAGSGIFNHPLLAKHNASLQKDAMNRGWSPPSHGHSHEHKKTWKEKYPKLENTILVGSVAGLTGLLIYGWTLLGQGSNASQDNKGNGNGTISEGDKIATFTWHRKSQNQDRAIDGDTNNSSSGNTTEGYYNRTISLEDAITEIPTILTKINSNLDGEEDETESEMLIEIYGNSIRLSDLEEIIKHSNLDSKSAELETRGSSHDFGEGKRVPKLFIA